MKYVIFSSNCPTVQRAVQNYRKIFNYETLWAKKIDQRNPFSNTMVGEWIVCRYTYEKPKTNGNQRKTNQTAFRPTATNLLYYTLYTLLSIIYIECGTKNPAVGWSVGRLVGFLRIFQSSTIKLFFEIQGSQGILDYILGKKKSIIERNLMMDC